MRNYEILKELSVAHITTAHQFDDVRIYHREAKLIAPYFKKVYICASGTGSLNEVEFISWGAKRPILRKDRLKSVKSAIEKIEFLKPDIIHFHDPEFLTQIKKIKSICKKVIYDIHEYYEGTLFENSGGGLKGLVSEYLYKIIENIAMKKIDGLVTVTPHLVNHYKKYDKPIALVRNFSDSRKIIEQLQGRKIDISKHKLLYSGSLEQKSLYPLAQAIKKIEDKYKNISVTIVGDFKDKEAKEKIFAHWENSGVKKRLSHIDRMSREKFIQTLPDYSAGLVLFWPTKNASVALPNKLFEYMCASLPVIVPDLPNQREVVVKYNCGKICDTTNPDSIAEAIDKIFKNEEESIKMGLRGKEACVNEYNAEKEVFNLLDLYSELFENEKK